MPSSNRSSARAFHKQVMQMSEAVLRHFPAGTRISQPQGGFVLWVELPAGGDGMALFEDAAQAGIAIVPGELFSAAGHFRNCLRLNCGYPWSPRIEDAIRRLGAFAAAQYSADRRAG